MCSSTAINKVVHSKTLIGKFSGSQSYTLIFNCVCGGVSIFNPDVAQGSTVVLP